MEELLQTDRRITLEAESQLEILIDENTTNVTVVLERGLSEIYGAEMTLNRVYNFPPNNSIGIFTWKGCTVKLTGDVKYARIQRDTLMVLNVVLHAHLQELRNKAQQLGTLGPVTLIAGPTDVGKSTLCRQLLNYAARMGNSPLYVELDVGQNSISVPGTVGILAVKEPADIINGFEVKAAKIYNFGHESPGHNMGLYSLMVQNLALVTKLGLESANPNVRCSGVIINTCGWVRGEGYDAITHAAMVFEVDTIIVIGEHRLSRQLQGDMPAKVQVHYMPNLTGAVERNRLMRFRAREARITDYFYGPLKQLQPFTFTVPFSRFQAFQVTFKGEKNLANARKEDIAIQPLQWKKNLVGRVFSLMKVASPYVIDTNLYFAECLGFLSVVKVQKKKVTVKSPQREPLPSNVLLLCYMRHKN